MVGQKLETHAQQCSVVSTIRGVRTEEGMLSGLRAQDLGSTDLSLDPDSPIISCVILGKSLGFSKLQYFFL